MTDQRHLTASLVSALPEALREPAAQLIDDYSAKAELPADQAIRESLPKVWACSPFVGRACVRSPELLADLCDSGDLTTPYDEGGHRARLRSRLESLDTVTGMDAELRRFRVREMARIAWRDLAGWADLDESLKGLSHLAEACIDEALAKHYDWECERVGVPRDADGTAQRMAVLGMGKLGGEELNFSSDIDLIFAYPAGGETDGSRPVANEQFFVNLGRKLINSLNATTAEGQVFRVDMRLRPYGDAGPLAMSAEAMEAYYQNQGRTWERYAMIKARCVGGDYSFGERLLENLRPFVYRRYLDYGALEAMREMKAMVAREVKRKGMEQNIKLGPGGIREIEFIGQVFQLIRGGREKDLQGRRILPVLTYLGDQQALPPHAVKDLIQGYEFLRLAENRLQAIADQQTHELPDDELDKARLAAAMGFDGWSGFNERLIRIRRRVQAQFEQVFSAPQAEDEDTDETGFGLDNVWTDELSAEQAVRRLEEAGFGEAERVRERLAGLRNSPAVRSLSSSGRNRLDRLVPLILGAAGGTESPDRTVGRVLDVVEAIVRRTAYLSLLVENPMALSQLTKLCSASVWITRFLARHPLLLDELLDPRSLYAPLRRDALERDLRERLRAMPEDDLEQQMEVLRQFKQVNVLRVAAADVSEVVPLMVVSDYLTDVAEVALSEVVSLAWRHLAARHGQPRAVADGRPFEPGFAVIAYGKLGGIELGYGSDLDLVFLHDSHGEGQETDGERVVDNNVFFARLAQRVIHILGAQTPGGILYEVDTRLRPSGKAGLLSTTLDAYADYQRNKAWTWEHQALVRARFVAGHPRLKQAFEAVRRELLARPRDEAVLREEVREMRERQRKEKGSRDPGVFDIKQDRGGIADIEFMVQYGVLSGAKEAPGLLRFTDNIRLLDELRKAGRLSDTQSRLLADAYRAYRARVHHLTLQEEPARVAAAEFESLRESVAALWRELMEHDHGGAGQG